MKVIIAGSRDFKDYRRLKDACDLLLKGQKNVEIVSGMARGADSLAIDYANEMGFKVKVFPADWKTHGKSAGPIRNSEMAKYADSLIAFWDGKSRGTYNMIELAKKNKLKVAIIKYNKIDNKDQL